MLVETSSRSLPLKLSMKAWRANKLELHVPVMCPGIERATLKLRAVVHHDGAGETARRRQPLEHRDPLPAAPAHGQTLQPIEPPEALVIVAHAFLPESPDEARSPPARVLLRELAQPLSECVLVRPMRDVAHRTAVKAHPAAGPAFAASGRRALGDDGPLLLHRHHSIPKTSFNTWRFNA